MKEMLSKAEAKELFFKYIEQRREFFRFLDSKLEKNELGAYDFSSNPSLNAKEVYERFFKLDAVGLKGHAIIRQTYEVQ